MALTIRTHDEAAAAARKYADRVVKARAKREGTTTSWITPYMRRYRYLTGRPTHSGPVSR